MNGEHRRQAVEKPYMKPMKWVFTATLFFLAVFIGIRAGDFMYKLDVNLVEHIDSENLKKTIDSAFPIIETIYNSGKKSVSVTREIKSMFAKIFDFDLDSPVTILNAQSPLFMSYYNHEYRDMLAMEDSAANNGPETEKDAEGGKIQEDPETETGDKDDGKAGDPGDAANSGEGKTEGDGGGGKNSDGDGGAGHDGTAPGEGTTTGENGEDAAGKGATGEGNIPQPISSITYEAEDDEEDDSDLVAVDKMVIRNFTKHKIDIAKLLQEPINFNFSKKGPKVLIYHTHTTESYVLKESDLGKKDVASYNSNPKYNVVRVGEELARNLEKYGIDTLHNGTVHDKKHDAAYGASLSTLQSYIKSYPSIKVFIDIHRDGLDSSKPKLRVVKEINGKNAAQIMFVMGTNDLLPNAHWEENLKFALQVQQKLNAKYPGLARPVWIVGKRYNQQVSNQAVLIEVGADGNLLSECLESTKYLAEALSDVMMGK